MDETSATAATEITRRSGAPVPLPGAPRCPGYVLGELLGQGGFGAVYSAWRAIPPHREVALKLLKPGHRSAEILARFDSERQALALMEHPGIARFLDAGSTPDDRPFFVMERVEGRPITAYCRDAALPLRSRLELFAAVCFAVHHAHQKGVLHRDLKPSNILVAGPPDAPFPKVIDFGIARAVEPDSDLLPALTRSRQLLGTLLYMSPEQARGQSDLDTRTDIYSLGVLLYELLTGAPPFADDEGQRSPDAILRRLAENLPPRPSDALRARRLTTQSSASRSSTSPVSFGPVQLRGDLDWIVMKALEKDRERRYSSAAAFAEDLQRHLEALPVLAGPPDPAYRARKFLRRHRAFVAAAAAVVLAAGAAAAVAASMAWKASAAARELQTRQNALHDGARVADEARREIESTLRFAFQDLEPRLDGPGESASLAALAAQAWDYLRTQPPPDGREERMDLARTLLTLARVLSAEAPAPVSSVICARAAAVLGPAPADAAAEPWEERLLRARIGLDTVRYGLAASPGEGEPAARDSVLAALSSLEPPEAQSEDEVDLPAVARLARDAADLALASGDLAGAERAARFETALWQRQRDPLALVRGAPDPAVRAHAEAIAHLAAVLRERGDPSAAESARSAIRLWEDSLLAAGDRALPGLLAEWSETIWLAYATLAREQAPGDPLAAARSWRRAADTFSAPALSSSEWKSRQARALDEAGQLFVRAGAPGEARAACLQGRQLLLAVQRRGPLAPDLQNLLARLEQTLTTLPEIPSREDS